jgi:hypothetical protein
MSIKHLKSPCCDAPSIKYGDRRKQCTRCKKTWRTRKQKRGRLSHRSLKKFAYNLFDTKSTVKQRARIAHLSERQYQYRMIGSLNQLSNTDTYSDINPKQDFILLIDGVWVHCEKKRAVIYLSILRPINSSVGYLLPPVVAFGAESNKKWQCILDSIPSEILGQIKGLVCDGVSGMTEAGQRRGWVVQRCQFHFIKTIERFRGKKNRFITEKDFREDLYQKMRRALVLPEGKEVDDLFLQIADMANEDRCPKWVKLFVAELLRYRQQFRAYILHPDLCLPATNNSSESLAAIIRTRLYLARGFRTMTSLRRWICGLVANKKHIVCNPARQPN